MLFQPPKPRHPFVELVWRIASWRPSPRRTDIRDLSAYMRDDIGAPDFPVQRCPGAQD